MIARINPINPSGCLHWFKTSEVICDANWLTGFSVMGIFYEGTSRVIWKIIFFVNRILLLLSVLRLALIFLIFRVCLVLLLLYCFSALVCANLIGKGFGRFACFDPGSTFIDAIPCTGVFEHSFVDWKNMYSQRYQLIWSNIVGQWEFSTANILFSI